MSQILSLGAINKLTGEYVYPKIANKKDEYICPECNKDLILVQGKIRVHHFRHKVDSINPCHHYSKPTESQIHKDAKMLLKTLLEKRTNIQFIRQCVSCKNTAEINLPEITEGSIITLEHRFDYEDELRIADVAHTLNSEIMGIYEICNKHKTCTGDRPEPWVEMDANSLLTSVTTTNNEPLIINCIRCEKCETCIEKEDCKRDRSICCECGGSGTSYWSDDCYGSCLECCCIDCGEFEDECKCEERRILYKRFIATNLEEYIRTKLGQNLQNPVCDGYKPKHDRLMFHAANCGSCNNCSGRVEGISCNDDVYHNNKKICDVFNNDKRICDIYKIVLYPWKGTMVGYLIHEKDYHRHDYWNSKYRDGGANGNLPIPYIFMRDYTSYGTVKIFEDLIKTILNFDF